MSFDRRHGVARLGRVSVDPAHRGHGFAAQFLAHVIRRTFAESVVMRIELNVFTFNRAAIRAIFRAAGIVGAFETGGSCDSLTFAVKWDERAVPFAALDEWRPMCCAEVDAAVRDDG
jgi:RimJ/RimL family protein N-acetyltransferase